MRFKEFKTLQESSLFEINMSPSSLKQLAAAVPGALAGMEFEMILPDVLSSGDPEPDYTDDYIPNDFDDVADFFSETLSRNERADLTTMLATDFEEWLEEKVSEEWEENGRRYFRNYVMENEFVEEDAFAEAESYIERHEPDLEPNSQEYRNRVQELANQAFEKIVDDLWGSSRAYDDAFDEFADETKDEFSTRDWFSEKNLKMSRIAITYDVEWPYYTGDDGEVSLETIQRFADSFSSAVGRKVNASDRYHGGRREPNAYVVEPDSSLGGDDESDAGLEFVSPPLPISDMVSDLAKVKQWAESVGAYTNDSTGLHINVSVPNFDQSKLDYVKLAVLLGDEYVLNEFGRKGNTYTKSAMELIKNNIEMDRSSARRVLDKMRNQLNGIASTAIHNGTTNKYTSINTKTGYIEFRSPGGDWLNENFDLIVPTLMRFVVALDAAVDPNKYKAEYLKKLYKVLSASMPTGGDQIRLFAKYAAGEVDSETLKDFIRVMQSLRKQEPSKAAIPGQKPPAANPNATVSTQSQQSAPVESVTEGVKGKISKRNQQASRGINTYSDAEQRNSDYVAYRLGMAVAGTDGKNASQMDRKSWIGKDKSTHPYTQEEQEMLKKAYQSVGAKWTDVNKGDMRSLELDSVNKSSPVSKPKPNKYGV